MSEDLVQAELMLNRFNRLIQELLRGKPVRNCFERWELDLLVDLETCRVPSSRRAKTLHQYRRAVQKQLERGPGPPLRLSEFLANRRQARVDPAGVNSSD